MDGGGFEPPKQYAADLQSVPFGHSGIHPIHLYTIIAHNDNDYTTMQPHCQADRGTRTLNLLITNQLLCQLSHIGIYLTDPNGNRTRVTAVKGRCLNRLTMGP